MVRFKIICFVALFVPMGCQESPPPSERAELMLRTRPEDIDETYIEEFHLKINGDDAFGADATIIENEPVKLEGRLALIKEKFTKWHYVKVMMRRKKLENGSSDWSEKDKKYSETQVASLLAREQHQEIDTERKRLSIPAGEYETRFYLIIQKHTPSGESEFEGTYLIADGRLTVEKPQERN